MQKKPGRVRIKLAKMLNEIGFTKVTPEDIDSQPGDYRKKTWDLACWMVDTEKDGIHYHLCSWSTMSGCIKSGLVVVGTNPDPKHYEFV